MFGPAIVEPISKSAEPIADALAKRLAAGTINNKEADDMDIKELEAALEKSNGKLADTIVAGLVKALKPEEKPAGDTKPTLVKVEFEGDPTNVEDIAKHEAKLAAARVDWNDPKSVAAYRTAIEKSQASNKPAGDARGNEGKSAELVKAEADLAKAQAELAKAQRASNQGTGDGANGNDALASATGLSKEVVAGFGTGSRMAKFVNGG